MNPAPATENRLSREVQLVVSIFAVLVALTYGTGFLCVHVFMERMGIREIGGDFFKGKYVHVGILFLFFPISILCPIIFAWSIRKIQNKLSLAVDDKRRIPLSSYFLLFNLGFVFYVYVLFLPPSLATSMRAEIATPIIICASIFGPALIWFENTTASRFARWTLVVFVVVGLDTFAFYDYLLPLWLIFWGSGPWYFPVGAIYYFVFIILIPFTIIRTNNRRRLFHKMAFSPFVTSDIADVYLFAQRLNERSDPISQFLYDQMPDTAKTFLGSLGQRNVPEDRIEAVLIEHLNKIISAGYIYEESRFRGVRLRPESQELQKKNLEGSFNFSLGNITNLSSFAKRLGENSDTVAQLLHEEMDDSVKARLEKYNLTQVKPGKIEKLLVKGLNRIISHKSLCEMAEFKNVKLRAQTIELLRSKPEKRELVLLNRLALEDAFPDDLSRNHLKGKELARLNRLLLEDAYPLELLKSEGNDPIMTRGVMELEINTLCVCLMFYFISTIAFGLKVYPYVPVAKGGGSYVDAPIVTLQFKDNATNTLSSDPDLASTNALVVLEQTPTSLFLALTNDAGGPKKWQTMHETNLPSIIEIPRDIVAEVRFRQHINAGTNQINASTNQTKVLKSKSSPHP